MPSRRSAIEMSPDEVAAYLRAQRRMILVTIGPAGMPHPVPMNYGVDDDGRIVMTAFAKSQKVLNLERDPRASLLVESGATYSELKSVMLYTRAEIVRDHEVVRRVMGTIRTSEELAIAEGSAMDDQLRASLAKRAALRFTPYRTISWDHAKLAGQY